MAEEQQVESQSTGDQVVPHIESEARQLGWSPKEQWRGDPENWVDASTFVKRGKEILPILKKNNETLLQKNATLESELKEIKGTVQEFKKYHEETEERAYKRALEELKAEKKQAIEDRDGERVVAIEEEMDKLKAEREEKKQQAKQPEPKKEDASPVNDPVFQGWVQENPWFGADKKLTAVASTIAEELKAENPGLKGRAFLDEVRRLTEEEMPHKFSSNRQRPNPVEGGTAPSPKGGSKYADLPPEAKAACDKFVKQGLITKEQYVKDYFGE